MADYGDPNLSRLDHLDGVGRAELRAWDGTPLKHDPVARPAHYTRGGIEVIDFIEDQGLGYRLGNVVKYVSRAGFKSNAVEDLKKARWYLDREIAALEKPTRVSHIARTAIE